MSTIINVYYTDCPGEVNRDLVKTFLIKEPAAELEDFIKRFKAKAMCHGDGNDEYYEVEATSLDDMITASPSGVEAALDELFGGPDMVENWEQYLEQDDEDEDD